MRISQELKGSSDTKNQLTGKGGNEEQVPSTESAFPHWMAADRRCLKYAVALELPDCQVILFLKLLLLKINPLFPFTL